jgi:hypothetical protein
MYILYGVILYTQVLGIRSPIYHHYHKLLRHLITYAAEEAISYPACQLVTLSVA